MSSHIYSHRHHQSYYHRPGMVLQSVFSNVHCSPLGGERVLGYVDVCTYICRCIWEGYNKVMYAGVYVSTRRYICVCVVDKRYSTTKGAKSNYI